MSTAALMTQFTARELAPAAGAKGELELTFAKNHAGVSMTRHTHNGPLMVQKPLYPEGPAVCHVCVLHTLEALAGADSLLLGVKAEPDSHALLTTQRAMPVSRNQSRISSMQREFRVDGGAVMEWLPQENIIHDGAQCITGSHVVLEKGARFIGWEIAGLGLPGANKSFSSGSFSMQYDIWHENRPLLLERTRLCADESLPAAFWGMGGRSAIGTLVAFPGSRFLLQALRTLQNEAKSALFSATLLDGVLVCRCLADDAREIKELFYTAWERIRPQIAGRTAARPRVWNS